MKVDNIVTYGIIFFGAVFFALTISNAGMFLNDEWVAGSQLDQLNQGHQIGYNEGKYGYHENGTISNYFVQRDNVLMYSMALPILAVPALKLLTVCALFDMVRAGIILVWLLAFITMYAGLYFTWFVRFDGERNNEVKFASIIQPIARYSWVVLVGMAFLAEYMILTAGTSFPVIGDYVPAEILAIVLTNVVLFGVFAVTAKCIIELVFPDNTWMQWVGLAAAVGCNSILFWVGTCKDHVLTITVVTIILYLTLDYAVNNTPSRCYGAALGIGLLAWIRPEVALGVGVAFGATLFYLNHEHLHQVLPVMGKGAIVTAIGTIPMFVNNYVVTGNLFVHPFMLANAQRYGGSTTNVISIVSTAHPTPLVELQNIIGTVITPQSGAASLSLVMPLVALSVILSPYLIYRWHQQTFTLTRTEVILVVFGVVSTMYYLLHSGFFIHLDTGIVPDLRYYSVVYLPLTLAALSVLVRVFRLTPIPILRRIVISTGGLVILSLMGIAILAESYRGYNHVMNILVVLAIGGALLMIVQHRTSDRRVWIESMVAVLIALPLTWQLVLATVYSSIKLHAYPMLIPATEWICNLIFVG